MASHPFDWQPAFLAALREWPVIRHACSAAGINRSTAWRAREADPAFAKEWAEAEADGVDRAEQAAFQRGVVGFEEPVVDKGRPAYRYERYVDGDGKEQYRILLDADGQPIPLTVRKHSDALLALVLKGRRKEVYAERTELAGVPGQPLSITDPAARAARVAYLMGKAQANKAQGEDFSDLA